MPADYPSELQSRQENRVKVHCGNLLAIESSSIPYGRRPRSLIAGFHKCSELPWLKCTRVLQAQLGQAGMLVRPATNIPTKLPVGFGDWMLVDAGDTPLH